MIVVADTNVILRTVVTDDDEEQTARAMAFLEKADRIIVPVVVFCEVAWCLRQRYKRKKEFVSAALRAILNSENIETNEEAVSAGLRIAEAGGDFADGVIQYVGSVRAGAPSVFVSFDEEAVKLLAERGVAAVSP